MKLPSTDNLGPRGQRVALIAALMFLAVALTFWAVRAAQAAEQLGWLWIVGFVIWDVMTFLLIGALRDRHR